ncbi:MAG TPA: hypothetical protein PKD86_07900 [Gemmatales bacterium]|nr:hypothetical protein [Gemmatales bacterium]HMP59261.1 hypothetical protein [Gemmatales bacterium]
MSAAAALGSPSARPRYIPAEVSNWLTSFWMTMGFGLLLLIMLWPEVGQVMGMFEGAFGRVLLLLILGGVVGVGSFVTLGVVQADESRYRLGKLFLLIAMIVGALAAIAVVIIRLQAPTTTEAGLQSPGFIGASPTLGAMLLIVAFLMPLFFGILTLSIGVQPGIKRFFNPPQESVLIEAEVDADAGPSTKPMGQTAEPVAVEDEVVVVEDDAVAFVEETAAADAPLEVPADLDQPLAVDSHFDIDINQPVDATIQSDPIVPVKPEDVDQPLTGDDLKPLDDESK